MLDNIYSEELKNKVLNLSDEELEVVNKDGLAYLWTTMISGNNDLHTHTSFSNGRDSPSKIMEEIMRRGLDAFSITDHDTYKSFSIIDVLYSKILPTGITLPDFIPGIELSAEYKGETIHILAYFPLGTYFLMDDVLERQAQYRAERNQAVVDKAQEQGIRIDIKDVNSMGGGVIGSIHIANVLLRKGYVASFDEAYRDYLNKGQPLYVKKQVDPAEQIIKEVRACGGVPVLSHPTRYDVWSNLDSNTDIESQLLDSISTLKDYGLQGIEVLSSEATLGQSRILANIGTELDLLPTAGSNYHGSNRPYINLRNKNDDPRKFLSLFYQEFRNKR